MKNVLPEDLISLGSCQATHAGRMQHLKKKLTKGESAAFVELYDLVSERLYRYVFLQLRSSEFASDVIQEVFLRLVKSHRALGRADDLNSYIFTITRNEVRRWLKKNKQNASLVLTAPDEVAIKTGLESKIDSEEWVKSVLSGLENDDREIIELKIYSQLTFKEIADVLDMKQSTVATRYRRAIAKLKSKLEQTSQSAGGGISK